MCSVLEGLRGKVAVQCFAVSLCECVCARARAERERTTARDRFTFCVSFTRASLDHGCQRDTEPPPPVRVPRAPSSVLATLKPETAPAPRSGLSTSLVRRKLRLWLRRRAPCVGEVNKWGGGARRLSDRLWIRGVGEINATTSSGGSPLSELHH